MKEPIDKKVLGWREWVGLPEFGVKQIKAKVDSGAKTSALHAEDIKIKKVGRKYKVHFTIYPLQRSKRRPIKVIAELIDERNVRSSVGHKTFRPVISTELLIGDDGFPIELTLVNRDILGFRMLLGREAIRGQYLIDPSKSFRISKTKKRNK